MDKINQQEAAHYRWRLKACVLATLQQMFFIYYDNGGRISDIAAKLERSEDWVNDRLIGRKKFTLNAISDLALAMGFEFRWQYRAIKAPRDSEQALFNAIGE